MNLNLSKHTRNILGEITLVNCKLGLGDIKISRMIFVIINQNTVYDKMNQKHFAYLRNIILPDRCHIDILKLFCNLLLLSIFI